MKRCAGGAMVLPLFFLFYLIFCDILYALLLYAYGGNSMEDATVVFSWAASAIGILGFLSVVIQQILFYKRDSKTMDRIENGVSSGHDKLERRMEHEHEEIANHLKSRNEGLQELVSEGNDKILSAITDVDKRLIQEFTEQKAKQTYLQGNESAILKSIDNLKSFADIMTNLRMENMQLKEQNQRLVIQNEHLQEKVEKLENNQSRQRSVRQQRGLDRGEEPEM